MGAGMWAQLKASLFCTGLTPHPGGGSIGVVEPLADGMYEAALNELPPNELAPKDVPAKGEALKPWPALDEYEFSRGVSGFGVVEIDDKPLLP